MVLSLDATRLATMLETRRWGRSLIIRERTTSTMDEAIQAIAAEAVDGHLIVADEQTQGRGARGRAWSSPPGTDLYLSVVCRLARKVESVGMLTLAVGLGVRETVESLVPGEAVQIKWPNDIWIEDRKCAGVLVESRTAGSDIEAVAVGVGLNVNRAEWPPELEGRAVSLKQARGDSTPLDRTDVLAGLLLHTERWVDRFVEVGPQPVIDALRVHLALLGERVRCDATVGIFEGVSEDGGAMLTTDDGVIILYAGRLERA